MHRIHLVLKRLDTYVNFFANIKENINKQLPFAIFFCSFSVLQWNLVARSINISSLTFPNIRWNDDHMEFFFHVLKKDQAGCHISYISFLSYIIYFFCSSPPLSPPRPAPPLLTIECIIGPQPLSSASLFIYLIVCDNCV